MKIQFAVVNWDKHSKFVGPTRTIYDEVIWREHGSPGQAIQTLAHEGRETTLENILSECEKYNRQEDTHSLYFTGNGVYCREKDIIDLAKLIEAGLVHTIYETQT